MEEINQTPAAVQATNDDSIVSKASAGRCVRLLFAYLTVGQQQLNRTHNTHIGLHERQVFRCFRSKSIKESAIDK